MNNATISSILFLSLVFAGYSQYQVITQSLENQVNHTLDFKQIRENPDNYQGEFMVVGGEVLSVNRKQDATRIEVLQLPLNDDYTPANQRTKTQGRFIAEGEGSIGSSGA